MRRALAVVAIVLSCVGCQAVLGFEDFSRSASDAATRDGVDDAGGGLLPGSTGGADAAVRPGFDAGADARVPGAGTGGASGSGGGTGGSGGDDATGGGGGSGGTGGSGGSGAGGDAGGLDAATVIDASSDAAPALVEDCSNGVDDDDDMQVDCADSDCTAWTCVPQPPDGWSEPVARLEGSIAPCGGGYPTTEARGGAAVVAAPATCSACDCSPGTVACANALVLDVPDACFETAFCSGQLAPGCYSWSLPCPTGQDQRWFVTGLPPGLGECAPSTATPQRDPASWDAEILVCKTEGSFGLGCATDRQCAPEPPEAGSTCIMRPGDHPCPVLDYTARELVYTSITDSRGCDDCTCDHDCSYSWRLYDPADTTCSAVVATVTVADQCIRGDLINDRVQVSFHVTGDGSCTPEGGAPNGTAVGADPVTVCCLP